MLVKQVLQLWLQPGLQDGFCWVIRVFVESHCLFVDVPNRCLLSPRVRAQNAFYFFFILLQHPRNKIKKNRLQFVLFPQHMWVSV